MNRWFLTLAVPFLTACPSNPPYLGGSALQAQVRALPGATSAAEVFGDASWIPFLRGNEDRSRGWRGGVVLADDAILFVIWDRDLQRVDIAKRIAYADVDSVDLEGTGTGRLMVVRQRGGAVHGFGFHGAARVDADATERAVAGVRDRMARRRGAS